MENRYKTSLCSYRPTPAPDPTHLIPDTEGRAAAIRAATAGFGEMRDEYTDIPEDVNRGIEKWAMLPLRACLVGEGLFVLRYRRLQACPSREDSVPAGVWGMDTGWKPRSATL